MVTFQNHGMFKGVLDNDRHMHSTKRPVVQGLTEITRYQTRRRLTEAAAAQNLPVDRISFHQHRP